MKIPAHKVIGDNGKPGQVDMCDKTLSDYIVRKSKHDALTQVNNEKKLSFDEWFEKCSGYSEYSREICKAAWNAAKEN